MKVHEVNRKLGFWVSFGFIDLDKGNVWPREYRWKCGCIGVSGDGEQVKLLPCPDHVDLCEVPEGWDVESMRRAALSRMDARGRFRRPGNYGGELREADRHALVQIFEQNQGNRYGRSKVKGGDSGSPQG